MAGIEDLANLGNLITQIRGQSSTTTQKGGTTRTRETTQTDISDEGINELVRGILSGPGGVGDIGGAARGAGVFDSTTEELLLGNLAARAAAQGEIARAPTTRETETETPDIVTTQEVPGMGVGPLVGTLAATSLAAPLVKSAAGAVADSGVGGSIANLFGGGGGGRAATGGARAGADFLSRTATGGVQAGATAAGSAAQGASIPGGFMSVVDTGGLPGGAGGVANAATSFLGGLQGQKLDPVDVGASIATGFAMGGPPGAAIAAIGSVLGNLGGKSFASTVICTALMERELLDRELYNAGLQYLYEMPDATRDGYHYWAIGVADKIRAGSKFWTTVCLPFAKGRTALLASQGTLGDHIRHPVGTFTKFVGEPICWTIGKVLAARERIYG